MKRDLRAMETAKSARRAQGNKKKQRGRDPGVAWILDFNNDGIVSFDELNNADEMLENEPSLLPVLAKDEL